MKPSVEDIMKKCESPALPYNAVAFGQFDDSGFEDMVAQAIKDAEAEINAIADNPEPPTFANTLVRMERSGLALQRILGVYYARLGAASNDIIRKASYSIGEMVSDYESAMILNEKLWERIKTIYNSGVKEKLDPESATLLQETYNSFRRNGALLAREGREELKRINAELTQLTTKFGDNVLSELESTRLWLGKEDADGLPQWLIDEAEALALSAGGQGELCFSMDQPVYMAFMQYSDRRDLRERMYRLSMGRNLSGETGNIPLIREIVELRHRKAKLLGYDTCADMKLEGRMAGTKEKVLDLLNKLADAYRDAQRREIDELTQFARSRHLLSGTMKPWDYSYVFRKFKETEFALDEEELREYFELDRVVEGVFALAGRLYGLKFKRKLDVPVYHEDVEAVDVLDSDGSHLGILYMDFWPRPGKRGGAWMTDFRGQWRDDSGMDHRPLISIVTNFTKPVGERPSLLTPREVETLLHEFGHALHGLLSQCRYESLSGTNVYRDFVELPSMFNENFMRVRDFMAGFGRHWKTGESIPPEMLGKLMESQRAGAAYDCMRQLFFGLLDMKWHTLTSDTLPSVEECEREVSALVSPFEPVDGCATSPRFTHIFSGGYVAGYYGYKWAEVHAADAFEAFAEKGFFDNETAGRFRREILEKGGSENPQELYRRFRGHDAEIGALLRRDGLQ